MRWTPPGRASAAILSSRRRQEMPPSVTVMPECFATFLRLASRPTRRSTVRRSFSRPGRTDAAVLSSVPPVASRSSPRPPALSSRNRGLGQAISRPPGKSGPAVSATASGPGASGSSGAGASAPRSSGFLMSRLSREGIQPGPAGLQILPDPGRGGHAPVTHGRHPVDAEAPADPPDLRRDRGRVGRVAREHFHRHRAAVGGDREPVGDPHSAFLSVTVVAEGRERAAPPLEAGAAHVIQDQGAAAFQVPAGQAPPGPGLARQQPAGHARHPVAGDRPQPEQGAEAVRRGLRRQPPGRGELRIG